MHQASLLSRCSMATAVFAALCISVVATHNTANAQIDNGGYWLYQPHQSAPVGRAWSSSNRTTEYWAYVVGEYCFPDQQNVEPNQWRLQASYASPQSYASFAEFKSAVLALPEMAGKTILFQTHVVSEETIEN